MARVLYGPALMDVMGTGNLEKMKELAAEAEQQLQGGEVRGYEAGGEQGDEGDLQEALTKLKGEIARIEGS